MLLSLILQLIALNTNHHRNHHTEGDLAREAALDALAAGPKRVGALRF